MPFLGNFSGGVLAPVEIFRDGVQAAGLQGTKGGTRILSELEKRDCVCEEYNAMSLYEECLYMSLRRAFSCIDIYGLLELLAFNLVVEKIPIPILCHSCIFSMLGSGGYDMAC